MTHQEFSLEGHHFQSLCALFSVVFIMDRELKILFASETLHRHMPGVAQQPLLGEAFQLHRPRALTTFDDLVARLDSLYLLTATDGKFAIRGQIIRGEGDSADYLVFCGAPWLHWMNTNCPEVKLGLNDFSHQDVQLDQLMYMATESNMVADLERMNSELKLAKEEVEKAQAARNAFFAEMSHEMRTPLNGVVSALSLMQEENPQGKTGELLYLAQASSRQMLQTINYVLDIAKLDSIDPGASDVEFHLTELLDSVIEIVRPRAQEKGLDLRTRINAVVPDAYRGNAESLRQALLNLLVNAVKFTDTGEISVDIDRGSSSGMSVRLEISDTGVGIPEGDQATIFEPYRTASGSGLNAAQAGSGLGLDIARRSVKSMGGAIGMSSTVGVGSCFWIELPLEPISKTALRREPERLDTIARPVFSGSVLLVDDNATNLSLTGMILEGLGVAVTGAASGEEAVELAQQRDYNLVLMDISMPGIDGYEAARRIRLFKSSQALPIIALSAYTGEEEKQKSQASGMNGYLVKPVEREELIETLKLHLRVVTDTASPGDGDPDVDMAHHLVDMDTVQSLERQIGLENLLSVVDKFGLEVERRWPALVGAASSADLARESHTLASTCLSFGLPGVADELRKIEGHAKNGGLVDNLSGLDIVAAHLRSGVTELRQQVGAMAAPTKRPRR